jgi:hypothetical protein
MATYDSLTTEQKAALALGDKWVRGALVSLKQFTDDADFDLKLQYWQDTIVPVLALLDAEALIPQASGHAGASDLNKAQMAAIKSWLQGIDTDMTTNMSTVVKAIGVNAG